MTLGSVVWPEGLGSEPSRGIDSAVDGRHLVELAIKLSV